MAIFGGQPAGIQIKKWLIILVSLIVLINVLAVASLVVLQRSVTAIQARYQPVLISASDISTQVYQAQASLYKYLGEYLEDTEEVEKRTVALEEVLQDALDLKAALEWQEELEAIRKNLAKYRVVIRNLPSIGTETDWAGVDEMRTQAVMLGQTMEEQASGLKETVGTRIGEKARQSLRLSRGAVLVFLLLLVLSTLITVLLLMWWRQFQEMILNL
jgi:hypothetical protein